VDNGISNDYKSIINAAYCDNEQGQALTFKSDSTLIIYNNLERTYPHFVRMRDEITTNVCEYIFIISLIAKLMFFINRKLIIIPNNLDLITFPTGSNCQKFITVIFNNLLQKTIYDPRKYQMRHNLLIVSKPITWENTFNTINQLEIKYGNNYYDKGILVMKLKRSLMKI